MDYFIKADGFLLENEETNSGYLEVRNGRFGSFQEYPPYNEELLDCSGMIVAPGLFDAHIHGIHGHDVMDGKEESLEVISKELAKLGVTSFLPTTLTSSSHDLEKVLKAMKRAIHKGLPGASSEGIFLEGPYFTKTYKGAQNEQYFRNPSVKEFRTWQEMSGGMIVKIALAPERPGSDAFIRNVTETGVQVSIGHADATFQCCIDAVENGASNYVHLFNGMRGMHHREPGVVGAALHSKETFAELICDGHHVHPDVAVLAYRLKGHNLVLITDCMQAGGMPDGSYMLGEYTVTMKNGIARTNTGSLAGSTLELKDGVRNLVKWSDASLRNIWHLASLSPARSVGLDNEIGSITPGKKANFTVMDRDFCIHMTAVEGKLVYKK